ncbi:MarR family transcriptional regulator, partial [Mycobacterium tuberculosis]|nr:MarR family transcriptional regulator [Mycobacterium tuberculosis]
VERRPDPRDKRGRLVFLTVRGQAVQPTAMAAGKRIQQNWESVAGKENIDVLTSTLQLVLEKLPRGE